MKTSSKKWQKIRKIKGLRQFVTWYPRHVSENPGCNDGRFLPIGVAQEVELIENKNGMYITGVGLVWHGGTEESVEMVDGKVTSFHVSGVGITKE